MNHKIADDIYKRLFILPFKIYSKVSSLNKKTEYMKIKLAKNIKIKISVIFIKEKIYYIKYNPYN